MPERSRMFVQLAKAVQHAGFRLCGGFNPEPRDDVPSPWADMPIRTVFLVGNAGPTMWKRFQMERTDAENPLDSWCRSELTALASQFGAHPRFPFQRPYLPFQRWLMRSEPCHASPLGILVHPRFGLWHAIRGALLFARDIGVPTQSDEGSPCQNCPGRPCLFACPVAAFSSGSYDVPRCAGHLRSPEGADCMSLGCRARRACPLGKESRYSPEQAAFHMAAFLSALSR